jgi:hypothetical protein
MGRILYQQPVLSQHKNGLLRIFAGKSRPALTLAKSGAQAPGLRFLDKLPVIFELGCKRLQKPCPQLFFERTRACSASTKIPPQSFRKNLI